MKRFTQSILKDGDVKQPGLNAGRGANFATGNRWFVLLILFLSSFLSLNTYAQTITVSGKVSDDKGGIPGVTVAVPGSTNGVTTDVNGLFSIKVAPTANLSFSSIGYKTQLIHVNNQTQLNIKLLAEDKALNEVVVVGYGTQKKVNLTGAVATVSGEELTKRPVVNAQTMLQGTMPGVQVVQNSGEPGSEGVSIRVRGTGTFSGATKDPLVLVDGVPGSLSDLNPTDIDNISVLKDASATAIYGSRAANGVVLVTTKSGKAGKMNIQYDGNVGIYKPTKLFKLITNSAEYMQLYNEARINSGLTDPSLLYPQSQIDLYQNATDRVKYPNTDWLSLIFRTAPTQQHNVTVSGGTDKTTYNV